MLMSVENVEIKHHSISQHCGLEALHVQLENQTNEWEIPTEAYSVLHKLAGNWTGIIDARDLILKPLKGAMTNQVYECHWRRENGHRPKKVLVRVYGEATNFFFDREDEMRTFERMSLRGQGPRLLARFPNGRVEEFLRARTLSAADLRDPETSEKIAQKLREFHQLDIPGPVVPKLWARLRDWLDKALKLATPEQVEEFGLQNLDFEIADLERRISKPNDKLGFCHNDLQYGNIMVCEKDNCITIIDYEYASYNPVAFDIANHFCEMAADYHTDTPHVLDYSKYPEFEERCRFVGAYLKASGQSVTQAEIEVLVNEVEDYVLASHLHWGLWGIMSVAISEIDFDFLEYARQRFEQYRKLKWQ